MSQRLDRSLLVDGLKALAAQIIVIHHLVSYGPMAASATQAAPDVVAWFLYYGRWAVQVFLVLAGFLTAQALCGKPALLDRPWSLVAGSAIGLVEMLFGTSGPLIVAWLTRRLPDVMVLRASTSAAITVSTCAVLLTMAAAGRLSQPELGWRWLTLIPLAIAGVLTGQRWADRVSSKGLRQAIAVLLVISGVALVHHALSAP